MDDVEIWGMSSVDVLARYRQEARAMDDARKARWVRRKARTNLRKWQASVMMTSVVMFWLHQTYRPGTKCAKRAKTQFESSSGSLHQCTGMLQEMLTNDTMAKIFEHTLCPWAPSESWCFLATCKTFLGACKHMMVEFKQRVQQHAEYVKKHDLIINDGRACISIVGENLERVNSVVRGVQLGLLSPETNVIMTEMSAKHMKMVPKSFVIRKFDMVPMTGDILPVAESFEALLLFAKNDSGLKHVKSLTVHHYPNTLSYNRFGINMISKCFEYAPSLKHFTMESIPKRGDSDIALAATLGHLVNLVSITIHSSILNALLHTKSQYLPCVRDLDLSCNSYISYPKTTDDCFFWNISSLNLSKNFMMYEETSLICNAFLQDAFRSLEHIVFDGVVFVTESAKSLVSEQLKDHEFPPKYYDCLMSALYN
jgi:hypothetical protein